MALTIAEMLNLGKGRAEYLLHPCGMIWACCTSGLDWSSVSLPQKRVMFGTHVWDVNKFATDVDVYPYLERPGSSTVTMKDGDAVLTGGDRTFKIIDQPAPVNNNPHNYRSNIQGMEGLQAIASTANDHNIAWGILSESFGKSDTTLNVMNDVGNRLKDNITAASGDPYLLWVGSECMAASAVAVDGTEIDITVPAGYRGLYGSVEQGHYLDNLLTPIYVSSSPLNGLPGRPCNLWMFVVDDTGAPVSGPVLMHTGKISKMPQLSGNKWSLNVLPWWSWLDYEMELSDVSGQLDKYVFSRAPATTQHPPHMKLSESDDNGATWTDYYDVYLCAAGSQVTYDTFNEFQQAVADACTALSAAEASLFSYTYNINNRGPFTDDSSMATCRYKGPLPAICDWGSPSYSTDWEDCQWTVDVIKQESNPWNYKWWACPSTQGAEVADTDYVPVSYIYQMYRTEETDYDEDEPAGWSKKWPPSVDSVTGDCKLYVKDEESIAALDAGDWFQIGTGDFWMGYESNEKTTLAKSKVGSISGKTITIDVASSDEYMGEEAIRGVKADHDYSSTKFTEGLYLYYRPGRMPIDPWPIGLAADFETLKLSTLFKALFGDTSEINVSERIQADHIPWSYDHGNWTSVIDWDTLDNIADELSALGLQFAFRYSGKINLWKEFQNCLRFLGCTPTWEWDIDDGHYKIRFRKVGTLNASIAQMSGRVLNADMVEEGSTVSANADFDPLYNAIDLKANYSSKEEKWRRKDAIKGNTAQTTGGKTVTQDVGARFIHVDIDDEVAWNAIIYHFGAIIGRTMTPNPNQTITATIKDKFAMGVGVEELVTLENARNPYTGVPGLTSYPCMTTSMTVDLDKCLVRYTYRVAPGLDNGWGPACIIPENSSTIVDADTIEVDDVSDDSTGRNFSNVYPTLGWYDHWFLGNLRYHSAMSEPETVAGVSDKQVILVERKTKTPTIITGLTAKDVDKRDYATISGAGDPFFDIEGAHVGYDVSKSWVVFFADRDTAGLTDAQIYWVYESDTDLQLEDSDANEFTGDDWK